MERGALETHAETLERRVRALEDAEAIAGLFTEDAPWDGSRVLGDEPHWMSGVEEDEYARVDGRWLHSRMALRVVFMAPHDRGWARRSD